jgi:hypothetical protein
MPTASAASAGVVKESMPVRVARRPVVTPTEYHEIVARPGQPDMATGVESVFDRVAHAESPVDDGKLGRGEASG